jgi:ATP-binding cassette subfamily B protein
MGAPRTLHLRRLAGLLQPYLGRWLVATATLAGGAAVQLGLPQAVRLGIDEAVGAGNSARLTALAGLGFAGFLVLGGLTFARVYLTGWLGARVVADLRRRAFDRLLLHPPGYFQERHTGELVSRLTDDIARVNHAVGADLSIALRGGVTLIGGLAMLCATSFTLTLAMLAVVPPVALSAVWVGRSLRKIARGIQDRLAEANSRLKEAISGIETVQAFRAEAAEARAYGDRIEAAVQAQTRLLRARGGFVAAVVTTGYSAMAGVLWYGAVMVIRGELSGGELAAFLLYTMLVTSGLVGLAEVWSNLQAASGAAGRVFDLMAEVPSIRDRPDARPLKAPSGRISFDGVSFCYPTRAGVSVLTEVSFEVAPGETVALVGPSGAGKSTVAALLLRFWDPDQGEIRVDGHDLRALCLADLRRAIAKVRQEPILFSGTIAENLAYGCPDAPRAAIRAAAQDAHIAEFVEGLPSGYETLVGERGVKLSGGQRQRVAIARALLADPKILILDEATSHLDTANEQLVRRALDKLMRGRTTLVIAHRLSTVQGADRILVLDKGRIVESGSHRELLSHGQLYARLTASGDLA